MFVKRLFDIVVASFLLVALSPVLWAISLLSLIVIGPPVIFVQSRPGLHGKPFRLLKFRNMSDERGPDGKLLPDAARLTRFGRGLRAWSLDELPQIWNVIRGDMSLVGPRPLLMEYLPLYSPAQARRHSVRPGLTGWAQINGRNKLSWNERFALDLWYIDNRTFWLDLKILFITIAKVLGRHGISAEGHVTMPPFEGQPKGLEESR